MNSLRKYKVLLYSRRVYKPFVTIFLIFGCFDLLHSQAPINDDCLNSTDIRFVGSSFCGNFDNLNATPSFRSAASCTNGVGADIWFKFTAIATEINVAVIGKTPRTSFTLVKPEVSILYGECGALFQEELRCLSSATGAIELIKGGLNIGEVYYIRIQGKNNTTGTFQFCLTNYNPPAFFDGDCPTGPVLCDKSPFGVHELIGFGRDSTEFRDAPCLSPTRSANPETSSTWMRWICDSSGTLTFKLSPFFRGDSINEPLGDDIDFALYELTSIDSCNGKTLLRCEAAGPYLANSTPTLVRRCMGATGLREGETGISEIGSCFSNIPHTNFLRPLDMIAGHSYALGVNNFSNTGNGFSIEWGGTGTFSGPKGKILKDKPGKSFCLGEDLVITDQSYYPMAQGQIVKKHWRFGRDASIDTANGSGPFRIFYATPGLKSIVLTLTSDRGCETTTVLDSILIRPLELNISKRKPTCDGGQDGMIRVSPVCGRPPITYNWGNGNSSIDSLSGLPKGNYRVSVTDSSGLYRVTYEIKLKEFEVELDSALRAIQQPRCFGQNSAIIQLVPVTGTMPFQYNWMDGRGYVYNSSKGGLGDGQYTVDIIDSNRCHGTFIFDVIAPPRIGVTADTINVSCYGRTDGLAIAHASGGVGNYKYNWSNQHLGVDNPNLGAGLYQVTVVDGNNCTDTTSVLISEPPQLFVSPQRIKASICYGDSTAQLILAGAGGTPPYRFSIDGVHFLRDTAFKNIPGRVYTVIVRDSTNCKTTIQVDVPQPGPIQVSAGADAVLELGFTTTLRAIVVPTDRIYSYLWTPFDSLLTPRRAITVAAPTKTTLYTVTVRDTNNCTAVDQVLIEVKKDRPVFVPNVFSPNHDGNNDVFMIFGNASAVKVQELKIFDRWGDMVFSAQDTPLNDSRFGWDGTFRGKDLTPQVFAYFAKVIFVDGEIVLYSGDITLMR
jgi:gliding motility-associated-like protein